MQLMRLISLLAACAVGACSPSTGSPVRAQATPQAPAQLVELLPPGVDLTGNWATGSASEPVAARIVLHPSCTYNPAVWVISQSGHVIEAWSFPESYNQGIAVKGPGPARVVASPGTVSGLDVTIDDGQSRYVLRYDKESGHLRGTRNGQPFWAARQVVVRTEACPGVP